jgi:protocatechuate 4,5-dioxygenase alpha chain
LIQINVASGVDPSFGPSIITWAARRAAMHQHDIPGTTIFDGDEAQKGFALNRMCFSFNSAENRNTFRKDEEAYMAKYGLSPEQKQAVREKNVLKMIAAGGNVYYLAKLAGIYGLNVQDIGAQQTGMSVEAFKQKLVEAGR